METTYEERVRKKRESQMNTENNNPCFKEYNISLHCMNDNNFDREMCQVHFENYRNCKAFWNAVQRQRRINGIKPLLPPLSEREEIKRKFFETGNI